MAHSTDRETFPVHPWLLAFRFAQLFFAILVVATTAFPLSIFSGGPVSALDAILMLVFVDARLIDGTCLRSNRR